MKVDSGGWSNAILPRRAISTPAVRIVRLLIVLFANRTLRYTKQRFSVIVIRFLVSFWTNRMTTLTTYIAVGRATSFYCKYYRTRS